MISGGFILNSHARFISTGNSIIKRTKEVHNQGTEEIIQPKNKRKIYANGTILRLRLSNIFHLESNESLLICNFLSPPFTNGNIQLPICQSPLIQRWRRFI